MGVKEFKKDIQQEKAINEINKNIYVTASAGSGKTRVLTERFLNILEKDPNVKLEEIIAITYTEKAANEMKSRILEKILKKINEYKNNDDIQSVKKWNNIKNNFRFANISTIHSFCSKIIREHPIECGINPDFEIINGEELRLNFSRYIRNKLISILEEKSPEIEYESAKRLIQNYDLTYTTGFIEHLIINEDQFETLYRHSFEKYPDKESYHKAVEEIILEKRNEYLKFVLDKKELKSDIDYLLYELPLSKIPDKPKGRYDYSLTIKIFIEALQSVKTGKPATKVTYPKINKTGLKHFGDDACRVEECFSHVVEYIPEELFSDDKILEKGNDNSYEMIKDIIMLYDYIKNEYKNPNAHHSDDLINQYRDRSMLTFDDLQMITYAFLSKEENKNYRNELIRNYKYIMVDECQDIDFIQKELVRLLAYSGEDHKPNLFIVGDGKQSIYKFRGADVSTFNRLINKIETDSETFDEDYSLHTNYRSVEPIVDYTNWFFGKLMEDSPEAFDISYKTNIQAHHEKEKYEASVEFIFAIEKKEQDEYVDKVESESRKKEAEMNADRIAELIKYEGVKAGEIAILMRSLNQSHFYERALSERNIKYQVVQGKGFYSRQEISDCINFLKVIQNEQNEIALLSVLRSPFCAVSDKTLFYLTNDIQNNDTKYYKIMLHKGFNEYKNMVKDPRESEKLEHLYMLVERLRRYKDRMNISQLMKTALEESGYYTAIMGLSGGVQKRANLDKFITNIKILEENKNLMLADLIDYIDEITDIMASESDAPIPDNDDSVTIMTIHKSKGLEFDYVFVPNLDHTEMNKVPALAFDEPVAYNYSDNDKIPSFGMALKFTDKSGKKINRAYSFLKSIENIKKNAELKRLLYVAFTRAKKHITASAKGDISEKGKLSLSISKPFDKTPKWAGWLLYGINIDSDELLDIYENMDKNEIPKDKYGNRYIVFNSEAQDIKIILDMENKEIERQKSDKLKIDENKIKTKAIKIKKLDHVTATSLITYTQCPRKYFYKFIERIKESSEGLGKKSIGGKDIYPENENYDISEQEEEKIATESIPLNMIGNIVHGLLEKYEDKSDFINIISNEINNQKLSILSDKKRKDIVISHINELLTEYTKTALYKEIQECKIKHADYNFNEFNFSFKIDGTIIEGAIDKIFKNSEGDIVVLDYKTNRFDKSEDIEKQMKKKAKRYDLQLDVYTLAASKLLNTNINKAGLYFLDVQKDFTIEARNPQDIEAKLKKHISEIKEKISKGANENTFPNTPKDKGDCYFCGYHMCENKKTT